MAVFASTTLSPMDAIDESLVNARWFLANRRFLMALETLKAAALLCRDARRDRIQALADALGGAPLVTLAA